MQLNTVQLDYGSNALSPQQISTRESCCDICLGQEIPRTLCQNQYEHPTIQSSPYSNPYPNAYPAPYARSGTADAMHGSLCAAFWVPYTPLTAPSSGR